MDSHKAVLGMTKRVVAMAGVSGSRVRYQRGSTGNHTGQGSAFTRQFVVQKDSFQNAMVKMLTVVDAYKGTDGASLTTYLHTVAKHEVMKSNIQENRPCWAPKSPQHVEVLPKHSVVEFSTQSHPVDPAREYDAAYIQARVAAIIDASPFPAAVREVLLDESSVRYSAHAHGLKQAELQAAVSKVTAAIKADAKLRDMAK